MTLLLSTVKYIGRSKRISKDKMYVVTYDPDPANTVKAGVSNRGWAKRYGCYSIVEAPVGYCPLTAIDKYKNVHEIRYGTPWLNYNRYAVECRDIMMLFNTATHYNTYAVARSSLVPYDPDPISRLVYEVQQKEYKAA